MDGVINLFHTVNASPWRDKYIDSFLLGCVEHQALITQNAADLHQVVAEINSKLNVGSSRHEGLLFLRTILRQFPDEVIVANAFSWASQAWNASERKSDDNQLRNAPDLPFEVLRNIIELSVQFPDVNKQILPMISKLLRKLTGNECKDLMSDTHVGCTILQCLQSCMKYYTAQCASYKGAIEKFLLGFASSRDDVLLSEASNCFLLLCLLHDHNGTKGPQVIGGGSSSCSFTWNQILSKLLATMQNTLDEMYENTPNFQKSALKSEKFEFPFELSGSPILTMQSLCTRYVNLAQFLCSLLTGPFPAAKTIPVVEVLSVVCQTLSVTCNTLKDKVSSESIALFLSIPQIHVAAVSVLSALMACARLSLLPYSSLIIKLLMQSLKWTGDVSGWPSGVKKPYSSLRASVYSTLSLWLQISSSASSAEIVADELIGMTLQDIVPSRETLTLVSSDSNKKHGKRHKRQKLEVSDSLSADKGCASTTGYKCAVGNGSSNCNTCCAALDMLTSLLYSIGPFLKPIQHKVIQEKVVSILVDIQRSSNNILTHKDMGGKLQSTNLILPYQSNAECRLYLYKLLMAVVLEPHSHKMPPPVGIAAKLFEAGSNDPNIEVSHFCFTSTKVVERLLHPFASTLNFPVVISELPPEKQSAYLNSVIDRVRLRGNSVHEISGPKENMMGKLFPQARKQNDPSHEYRLHSDKRPSENGTPISSSGCEESKSGTSSPVSVAEPGNDDRCARTNSNIVLVRKIEKTHGSLSFHATKLDEVPVTTIQNVAIQVNDASMEDGDGSLSSSCCNENDKVLVLKLPLEKTEESKKDFAQQWSSGKDDKQIELVEVDIEGDDERSERIGNTNKSQISKDLERDGNDVALMEEEPTDVHGSREMVIDKMHPLENHIEVINLDDNQRDEVSPCNQETTVTEMNDDDLCDEEKEMMKCFVDVSSDSE